MSSRLVRGSDREGLTIRITCAVVLNDYHGSVSESKTETIHHIHELGHEFSLDHLSSEYHDGLCRVGARLVKLAMHQPSLFQVSCTPESR